METREARAVLGPSHRNLTPFHPCLITPHRTQTKDCERCCAEIPLRATRCKFCTADMVLTQAQIEELAVLAELAKPFNGKGLMGCAPCITVGKHAVKYGREASEIVLKRKLSRGKSASKAGSASGKGARSSRSWPGR